MNLRDLEYLVALVEHRHFGKAAKACFVSQPALSMQIKKLEDRLGVKLIERNNKSVMLTEIGLSLAKRAQAILNQIDDMEQAAKTAVDPYSSELKLGIFPTLAPYLLPFIIPPIMKAFPQLPIALVEEETQLLIEKLQSGKIDTAILALPINAKGLTSMPLFDEEFLLAVPKSHSLSSRKYIQQKELENKELLLLNEGHCLRDQALALCYRVNATETKGFKATSLETLRHLVAAGLGITLIPKLATDKNEYLSYIPFNNPKPLRSIGLVWRTTTTRKVLLKEFIHIIQNAIKTSKL